MKAAIEQRCHEVFADARAEGRNDSHSVYMVEALVTLILIGNVRGDAGASDESEVADEVADDESPEGAPAGADDTTDTVDTDADCDGASDASDPVYDKAYEDLLATIRGPAPPGPPRRVRRAQARARRAPLLGWSFFTSAPNMLAIASCGVSPSDHAKRRRARE